MHTGDYFDILVPESIDMSSDKLDRTFPIIDSATGDNIGEGTLHPNGTEGGKISVVFNEQANNRSNLSGNVYLWVPFNKNHIELNKKMYLHSQLKVMVSIMAIKCQQRLQLLDQVQTVK